MYNKAVLRLRSSEKEERNVCSRHRRESECYALIKHPRLLHMASRSRFIRVRLDCFATSNNVFERSQYCVPHLRPLNLAPAHFGMQFCENSKCRLLIIHFRLESTNKVFAQNIFFLYLGSSSLKKIEFPWLHSPPQSLKTLWTRTCFAGNTTDKLF